MCLSLDSSDNCASGVFPASLGCLFTSPKSPHGPGEPSWVSQPPDPHLLHGPSPASLQWVPVPCAGSPALPSCPAVLGMLSPALPREPVLLLIFAARTRCWVMFILLAAWTPRAVPAEPRSSWLSPSSSPLCRTWCLVDVMRCFSACLSSSWTASQASAVSTAPPISVPSAHL